MMALSRDPRLRHHGSWIEECYPRHSEGQQARLAKLITDGQAFRYRVTMEGARQIVSLHIAGDFVDLEGSLLKTADHNIQVL